MKNILIILLLAFSSVSSFAKKDINAWKNEKSIDQQFIVFKQNLNYWNGSYIFKEPQLDEFYKTLMDSVLVFKNEKIKSAMLNVSLQTELETAINQMEESKAKLDESLKWQNSIVVLGIPTNKTVFMYIVYGIILALLVLLSLAYLINKRSGRIARIAKNEYIELKEEFDAYKKNSLERYTRINTELHHTRLELNRKFQIRS